MNEKTKLEEVEELLLNLVTALDTAFISSWQSTHSWQHQLEMAQDYFHKKELLSAVRYKLDYKEVK